MSIGRGGRGGGEKIVLVSLLLLSIAALVVFLYYTFVVLSGLPNPIPNPTPIGG